MSSFPFYFNWIPGRQHNCFFQCKCIERKISIIAIISHKSGSKMFDKSDIMWITVVCMKPLWMLISIMISTFVCFRSVIFRRKMFVLSCLWMSKHCRSWPQMDMSKIIEDLLVYGEWLLSGTCHTRTCGELARCRNFYHIASSLLRDTQFGLTVRCDLMLIHCW